MDENLIIPLNDSISCTISIEYMCAKTSITVSDEFTEDRMWLNGAEVDIPSNERLVNCLKRIRSLSTVEWSERVIHICSENNFPTAAGLASSAAGYAGLMYALAKLFGVVSIEEISTMARVGSGSACRSVNGGFVQWVKGHNSQTSIARQIVDEHYWPELRVLILVVNETRKLISSTLGMQLSKNTSALMKARVNIVLPERISQMILAIKSRDFHKFAELTIKDSNQIHAICEDTYPPIDYMNDISRSIRKFVHKYNDYYGMNRVAYTFDAGPNACLYILEEEVPKFIKLLLKQQNNLPIKGSVDLNGEPPVQLIEHFSSDLIIPDNSISYIISTRIGAGPQIIDNGQSLLNDRGFPKNI